jgi:hypothetical protein
MKSVQWQSMLLAEFSIQLTASFVIGLFVKLHENQHKSIIKMAMMMMMMMMMKILIIIIIIIIMFLLACLFT